MCIRDSVYTKQENFPEALKNQMAAVKIFEETGNKKGMVSAYNNIGMAYTDQGIYLDKALENYFASVKICRCV